MATVGRSSARGPTGRGNSTLRAPVQAKVATRAAKGPLGLGGTRGFSREEHDLYPTERPIAETLVRAERFDGGAWECACGLGDLSRVLIAAGVDTVSTDLVARGYGRGGVDFLKTTGLRKPNVVTNPPFKLWLDFAMHALRLGATKVALLGRLLTVEDWQGRAEFFRQTRLSRIVVAGRGTKMRAHGSRDKGFKGTIAYAWYVWDRLARWHGGPILHWPHPGMVPA